MSQQSLTQAQNQTTTLKKGLPFSISLRSSLLYLVLVLLALVMLFPYYYMIINALKEIELA